MDTLNASCKSFIAIFFSQTQSNYTRIILLFLVSQAGVYDMINKINAIQHYILNCSCLLESVPNFSSRLGEKHFFKC